MAVWHPAFDRRVPGLPTTRSPGQANACRTRQPATAGLHHPPPTIQKTPPSFFFFDVSFHLRLGPRPASLLSQYFPLVIWSSLVNSTTNDRTNVQPFRSSPRPTRTTPPVVKMPPKKKGSKKGQDDWEADLGEPIAPTGAAPSDDAAAGEDNENDEAGGGGLMAMLRKNKEKRKKKGLPEEDFVQGEDPAAANDVAAKAPAEATIDDEFALPEKKGKGGGKGKQAPQKNNADDNENRRGWQGSHQSRKGEAEEGAREAAKEGTGMPSLSLLRLSSTFALGLSDKRYFSRLPRRRLPPPRKHQRQPRQPRLRRRLPRSLPLPLPRRRGARRRSFQPILP